MSRFVRASKVRHVFGTPNKKELCYDNIKVTRSAHDSNLIKVNPVFVSVVCEAAGGGAFLVHPLDKPGKLSADTPICTGHTAAVLDVDFNPFNDFVIASGSEDTKVMIWNIPEGGLTENLNTPALVLSGHGRKVGTVSFHPTAENVLATASFDLTVKLWDIVAAKERLELTGHMDFVQSMSWNWNGSLLATTSKDKKLRVYDVRANKVVQEVEAHQGVKGSRCCWLGTSNKVITTGFSKTSDRQFSIWDAGNFSQPLKVENIDTSSGVIMPFYDQDTNMLYLAGKGDGNIRIYETAEEDPFIFYINEHKTSDPQRGLAFLPKRGINVNDTEIARGYKLMNTIVEPISFKIPRKSDVFQADLYPETVGDKPSLTAAEFFSGKNADPVLISLEKGYQPQAKREFQSTAGPAIPEEPAKVLSEKELRDAYHSLRKETEDLKNQLAQKDVLIRQLEAKLENLKTK